MRIWCVGAACISNPVLRVVIKGMKAAGDVIRILPFAENLASFPETYQSMMYKITPALQQSAGMLRRTQYVEHILQMIIFVPNVS